ncbi:uncharacterized protein BX663DRAFT_210842 [Cokeromyces recurvatus]|uniref:uncharacterized protein n=1 Tax=Cokeromyces recurvatus TaxID=90255 RepID=UPI0022210A33|nr:uncharacterized protein BX663DRAFT_210842 [Cokeromyces recurvatus]KAI7899329.1 hypothetical protein BX663DRAFT_210842 [Cokeromyces recurvatus]
MIFVTLLNYQIKILNKCWTLNDMLIFINKIQKKSKNTAAIPYKYDENSYNEIQRTILTKYKTPSSMIIPATEEQMSIIEQVAKHANSAKDSNLFEIQVQVKNSTNSLYSFLNKQDPLYSFYKHVQWLNRLGNYYSSDSEEEEEDKGINIPSLETQQIIDKTAKYIAKSSNGAELEKRLKERKNHDPKFGFIHPDHLYHSFYKSKIKEYKDTCK